MGGGWAAHYRAVAKIDTRSKARAPRLGSGGCDGQRSQSHLRRHCEDGYQSGERREYGVDVDRCLENRSGTVPRLQHQVVPPCAERYICVHGVGVILQEQNVVNVDGGGDDRICRSAESHYAEIGGYGRAVLGAQDSNARLRCRWGRGCGSITPIRREQRNHATFRSVRPNQPQPTALTIIGVDGGI